MNSYFLKDEIRMKKCLPSLAMREIQTKTKMIFHLTPLSMAIIKKSTASTGKSVDKENTYTRLLGVGQPGCYGSQYGDF